MLKAINILFSNECLNFELMVSAILQEGPLHLAENYIIINKRMFLA